LQNTLEFFNVPGIKKYVSMKKGIRERERERERERGWW
jgi:hypothetical protein